MMTVHPSRRKPQCLYNLEPLQFILPLIYSRRIFLSMSYFLLYFKYKLHLNCDFILGKRF